ncbi:MAG: hypothetical protein KA314_07835 [Chloroflexi bacterium]|nr:hypothetical protein [Chloroflexota bacterium]MBP8055739.1 hypothetical protein [Chloroflexota bacterium]
MTQPQTIALPPSTYPNTTHFWFYGLITALGTLALSYLVLRFRLNGDTNTSTELSYYQNLGVPYILLSGLFVGGIQAQRRIQQPKSSTITNFFVASFTAAFLAEMILGIVWALLIPHSRNDGFSDLFVGTVFIICGTGAGLFIGGIFLRLLPHARLDAYPRLINLLNLAGMGVGLGVLAGLLRYVTDVYKPVGLYPIAAYIHVVYLTTSAVLLGLGLGLIAGRFQFKIWSLYLMALVILVLALPLANAITILILNRLPITLIFTVTADQYKAWTEILRFSGRTIILLLLIATTGFAYLFPGKRVFGAGQPKPEQSGTNSQEQMAQAVGALAGLAVLFVALAKIFGGTSQNGPRSQPGHSRRPVAPPPVARPNAVEQWQKEHAAHANAQREANAAAKQQQQAQAARQAEQQRQAELQRQAEMKRQKELEWQKQERERQAREQQEREREERMNIARRQEADKGYRSPWDN